MSNRLNILASVAVGALAFGGCAHQSSERADNAQFSDPNLSPTSSSSAPRVYGTTTARAPGGGMATLTITNAGGATPATAAESELLDRVRQLLVDDKMLVRHPSQVTATLHPEQKGVVVLSGKVPDAQAKKAVIDRVAALPGVARVDDRIETGDLPDDPSTAKYRDIVPQK